MLTVSRANVFACGGFLAALADASAEYLHGLVKNTTCWDQSECPDRFVVHKAPHLDDYLGELLFRAAIGPSNRRREFLEQALYSEDDSTARAIWPTSAVFGIGNDKPIGTYAQYLFDEHLSGGGRTIDSCAKMVAKQCFTQLPDSLKRVVQEVTVIDSIAGAHQLHLNNLLKVCHNVPYSLGQGAGGRPQSGTLSDSWKRAVVNAMVAAMVYCLENGIDVTASGRAGDVFADLFGRFVDHSPYRKWNHFTEASENLKKWARNTTEILRRARIQADGNDEPQLLVLPFMAAAAVEVWGKEIAYFLLVHFFESEILKNIHYATVMEWLEHSFSNRRDPKPVSRPNCSLKGIVLPKIRFKGKVRVKYQMRQARDFSPLWIVGCRHNNHILHPNKAITTFISEQNNGIGLILCENTKEGSKFLCKGQHLPDPFWEALVERILADEKGLWYRINPTTPFLLNGNPAHQYVQKSVVTPGRIAKLSTEISKQSI